MDSDNQRFESVFTEKVRAGRRRTYFFDVRKTKKEDYYVTITESTKKFEGEGYERHKLFLYKEDFNRFVASLENTINHIKNDLLPEYDYDEFTKKQAEWEEKRRAEDALEAAGGSTEASEEVTEAASEEVTNEEEKEAVSEKSSSEDDMSW